MRAAAHPIERQSYRILRSLIDLSHLPPLSRTVTERVIHASADLDYAETLVLDEGALRRGHEALRGGATVVADVAMVASGVASATVLCLVGDPRTRARARVERLTRSAAGFRLAARALLEADGMKVRLAVQAEADGLFRISEDP